MTYIVVVMMMVMLYLCSFQQPAPAHQVQKGLASFYAKKFNGRKTSSGERFSNDSLTAAHKTLPFGTWLRVTNLKNDSTVLVRVNDRLPRWSKRNIDLTQKAARHLNFIKAGLARVTIEVMDAPAVTAADTLK